MEFLVKVDSDNYIVIADIMIPNVACGECGQQKRGPDTGARVMIDSLTGAEGNQFGEGNIPLCDVKGRIRDAIEADILRQWHKRRAKGRP